MRASLTATLMSLAIALSVVGASAPAAAEVHRFALVVGSNEGDPGAVPLRHAQRDALKVADVLRDLGDVPSANVRVLTETDADAVRRALDELEEQFARALADDGDRVVFILYYSGHGTSEHLEIAGSHLPLKELRARLKRSRATVRLAILDACYSGAMVRLKGGRRAPAFPLRLENRFLSEGYAFMTSSSADEGAQESDDVQGSFFTHFLTSGLRGGADTSGDGQVTLEEVYRYTYHRTLERSVATGLAPQHPHFDYDLRGAGELVLTRLDSGAAKLTFPADTEGDFLLYAPARSMVMGEVAVAGGEPRTLALPAGEYRVFQRSGDGVRAMTVQLAAGSAQQVDTTAMEPAAAADFRRKGAFVGLVEQDRTTSPRRVAIAPKLGYQGAFQASARRELIAPAPVFGLEVVWERVGVDFLSLVFDATASYWRADMSFDGVAAGQEQLQIHIGATALFGGRLGPVRLAGGPRVAAVLLRRDVDDDVIPGTSVSRGAEEVFTGSPAAVLRADFHALDWLTVGVEGRVGYLRLDLDGAGHDVVYGEMFATLGFYP